MRLFYDTEFLETGSSIDLISIGFKADGGDEYYAVVADDDLINRVAAHPWLSKHVLPSLPVTVNYDTFRVITEDGYQRNPVKSWRWDLDHPGWKHVLPRSVIARQVREFICSYPDPQLWAWYGAFDHVVLSWLWGPMVKHPVGVPMWTNDLRQESERLGNPRLPEQASGQHNALEDARHNLVIARALDRAAPDA